MPPRQSATVGNAEPLDGGKTRQVDDQVRELRNVAAMGTQIQAG